MMEAILYNIRKAAARERVEDKVDKHSETENQKIENLERVVDVWQLS